MVVRLALLFVRPDQRIEFGEDGAINVALEIDDIVDQVMLG